MKPNIPTTLGVLIGALVLPAMAVDQDAALPDRGDGYLTFYLDNDLFSGTDEDYTNGARLTWVSKNIEPEHLPFMQRYLRHLSGDSGSIGAFQRITGFKDPD